MSDKKLRPGLTLGVYPQQDETWPSVLEVQVRRVVSSINYVFERHKYTQHYILKSVNGFEQGINKYSEYSMQAHIFQLRKALQLKGLQEQLIAEAFATIREVSRRVLGKRHFDVQVLGGWVIINGMLAEMETGQGKTLTASLPACAAALTGIPVHIITANDYLAERDEKILRPLYQQMHLTSASVVDGMDAEARKQAYQCDIVHTSSQQIIFDYLRDRVEMGDDIGKQQIQLKHLQRSQADTSSVFLLRGLCFTIIDEADSLLVDEAKTPLIISQTRESKEQKQNYFDALFLATSLDKQIDFTVDRQYQDITLTTEGKNKLVVLIGGLDDYWQQSKRREFLVILALKAKHLFFKDTHYLVRNNKVEIIDALTGRAMPGRSWEHGLQQLIEAKEGCEIMEERDSLARISYQKFFKRYFHLSGMSGTLTEVARELNNVYGLRVVKVPTHQLCKRKTRAEKVYVNREQKWQALIQKVTKIHQTGQPLLIGTNTVADSEKISDILTKNKLPHQVLNAYQDEREAEIISMAGQLNSITVATNMAGRGTDICLGPGVEETGGLHVIATTRSEARRVDRQLYGRSARQGDSGSSEAFMSLQDEWLVGFYSRAIIKVISGFCIKDKPLPDWLGNTVLMLPQKWTEYKHYKIRCMLIKQDKKLAKMLSFTGRME